MTAFKFPFTFLILFLCLEVEVTGQDLTGVYRPISSGASSEIEKLTLSKDGSADVEFNVTQYQASIRLGKMEQSPVTKRVQATGQAQYLSPEKVFEGFENSETLNKNIPLFKDGGYDKAIVIILPKSSGKQLFLLFHKNGSLVEFFSGEKLKATWW